MALSPEELEQIRQIVRSELRQHLPFAGVFGGCLTLFIYFFVSVLALHVLVIGGVFFYHLLHSH